MGIRLSDEFRPTPNYAAWGPFIPAGYVIQPVTYRSIITAGVIFGLTCIFALLAVYIAFRQTRVAREPWRSLYIWMIWMEIVVSMIIGIQCLFYLIKIIRPSFWFFMFILIEWSIQIQLLLQIIVNRIRIILADERKGHMLMVVTAILVGIINVSVFCIWIPARLQISNRWIHVNDIWDHTEKALFLILDAFLNYYFIRVVKANLIEHGLKKYNTLVRFNQYMIVVSLLMDVMIIAAMSFPNGFVYAMFHPLAYLVKLNIEMSMAHLIKTIALDRSRNSGNMSHFFVSNVSSDDAKDAPSQEQSADVQQVSIFQSFFGRENNHSCWDIEDGQQPAVVTRSPSLQGVPTRPPIVNRNSLSWVDRGDSVGLIAPDWAHVDDEISLVRLEPALLPCPQLGEH